MFKRQYFVAGEIYLNNGSKTMFFRQFWFKSFLPNSPLALQKKQEEIAKDNNVEITDLAITAFNRC